MESVNKKNELTARHCGFSMNWYFWITLDTDIDSHRVEKSSNDCRRKIERSNEREKERTKARVLCTILYEHLKHVSVVIIPTRKWIMCFHLMLSVLRTLRCGYSLLFGGYSEMERCISYIEFISFTCSMFSFFSAVQFILVFCFHTQCRVCNRLCYYTVRRTWFTSLQTMVESLWFLVVRMQFIPDSYSV